MNRYIVRYRDTASTTEVDSLLKKNGGTRKKKLARVFNGDLLDLTPGQANLLNKETSSVLWVEKDQSVNTQTIVQPSPSWGLDRIDQRTLPVNNVYSYTTTGAGVDAYVVDSGILSTHAQFTGRIRMGYDGYGGTGNDCNGHGTHVAGIIAGSTYGVAPQASLVAVRALDCSGAGTVSGVIAAIDWVVADHTTRPAVMNLSLGTTQSPSLESAVDRAYADGVVVVAAAGNSNIDACTTSPSGDRASVLSVGASNEADSRASFSNFGKCLDLFAPGTNIVSAGISNNSATAMMSGTSMAAPHVAGLVARYLSAATTASPATVMDAIINNATPNAVTNAGTLSPTLLAFGDPEFVPAAPPTSTPSGSGAQPQLTTLEPGAGTVDAPSVPGVTGKVTAIAENNSSWLSWIPALNGGSPTTANIVRVYKDATFVTQVFVDSDTLHLISDLVAARTYSFTVAAMNAYGVGPFSPRSNSVVPVKSVGKYKRSEATSVANVVPATPRSIGLRALGNRTVSITWNPPRNARATSYQVWFYKSRTVVAKVTTIYNGGVKLYGFVPGKYAVRVRAVNQLGESTLTRSLSVTIR
jgi:subtilisin family serine protease